MNDSSAFGLVLSALRRAEGLSREVLAERAGLSLSAVKHLERRIRAPSYATAAKLADVLGVGLDAFREGPNQRPVESGNLRDARLAALQRWHREESQARRRRAQDLDELSPATRRELSPATMQTMHGEVERRLQLDRDNWCEQCLCFHGPGVHEQAVAGDVAGDDVFEPRVIEDDSARPAAQAAELVEHAGQAAELVEHAGQAAELVEHAGQAAELVEQLPPGHLTAEVFRHKAELGQLDPGDRKAFHQARRRATAAGQDGISAALAGYAAVRRHRQNVLLPEKRRAGVARAGRSRPRPTKGPAEKPTQEKA